MLIGLTNCTCIIFSQVTSRVLYLNYVSFSRSNSKVKILDKIDDRGPDDFGRFHDYSYFDIVGGK